MILRRRSSSPACVSTPLPKVRRVAPVRQGLERSLSAEAAEADVRSLPDQYHHQSPCSQEAGRRAEPGAGRAEPPSVFAHGFQHPTTTATSPSHPVFAAPGRAWVVFAGRINRSSWRQQGFLMGKHSAKQRVSRGVQVRTQHLPFSTEGD